MASATSGRAVLVVNDYRQRFPRRYDRPIHNPWIRRVTDLIYQAQADGNATVRPSIGYVGFAADVTGAVYGWQPRHFYTYL